MLKLRGVNGRIDDLNENGERLDGVEDRYDDIADVKWLRGPCCFYRRRALMECGSFDPQLAMEEEAELGLPPRPCGLEAEYLAQAHGLSHQGISLPDIHQLILHLKARRRLRQAGRDHANDRGCPSVG